MTMKQSKDLKTVDVVANFLKRYLNWVPDSYESTFAKLDVDYISEVVFTSQVLYEVAKDMRDFIEESHKQRFVTILDRLVPGKRAPTDAFKVIADQLFLDGITWSCIITFLVYFAEIILRVLASFADCNTVAGEIFSWMKNYINKKLIQWIQVQPRKWQSIMDDPIYNVKSETCQNGGSGTKLQSKRRYFGGIGLAACAILFGSLYLCSRLSVQ